MRPTIKVPKGSSYSSPIAGAKVMTLRGALLNLIERRKLDICPVLARNGDVDFWVVGVRAVNPRSGQNTVRNRVRGDSLEAALATFLSSTKKET